MMEWSNLPVMSGTSIQSRSVLVAFAKRHRNSLIVQKRERTAMRKGLSTNEGSAIIGVGVVAFGSMSFTTGHLHFFMPHGEHAHHAHHGHTSHQESNGQETVLLNISTTPTDFLPAQQCTPAA
jgi:hypothetical protein